MAANKNIGPPWDYAYLARKIGPLMPEKGKEELIQFLKSPAVITFEYTDHGGRSRTFTGTPAELAANFNPPPGERIPWLSDKDQPSL